MKPKTLDWILLKYHPTIFKKDHDKINREQAIEEILVLVSEQIQLNSAGFGLTVAEGDQLARRVRVGLM